MKKKIDWWSLVWRLIVATIFIWHVVRFGFIETESDEILKEGIWALLWAVIIAINVVDDRFTIIDEKLTEIEEKLKQNDRCNNCSASSNNESKSNNEN